MKREGDVLNPVVEIDEFREKFNDGKFSDSDFFDTVSIYGHFGALGPAGVDGWSEFSRQRVVGGFENMYKEHEFKWGKLKKCRPEIVKVADYVLFPKRMPDQLLAADDFVLDFRMSESVFQERRTDFDEAPVFLFRRTEMGYKVYAIIIDLP